MCVIFTRQHIGIILTIIGTACLAYSVKTETQYTGEVIAKRFVMPECSYRASMISGSYKPDSRPEASRE